MIGDQSERNRDSMRWKNKMFTSEADALIADIVQLGGEGELERTFNQFRREFEPALRQLRDRLMSDALDRGLET